ncbi:bifunctional chorismate synthase/riboflavin reductase [NAD(P)H] aro2 [Mycoemilia scoparia]|uniref:Chorismate synthase n=1 Tax=Mycoemilia scoparia TaxID=417184 RepID=A0A9W8DNJ3_9FUNG|nr:bifunctional chorismate synthase/riboflavin reductase [NAD(P)H] aro2 [Mycoemilia scoparia]
MSSFGEIFRVTTYGESHCKSVGCIVEGCPPGMALTESDIQPQMSRRRPGQSKLTTPRNEKDQVQIQSGTEYGYTLGTPIGLMVQNEDHRPHDYSETDLYPRPSHADWTYLKKYGVKASSGGGRSSARETIGRVAAGTIAEKYLKEAYGVEIVAFVSGVGKIEMESQIRQREAEDTTSSGDINGKFYQLIDKITREDVDSDPVRCPDSETAVKMKDEIVARKEENNSTGGIVTCVIRKCPIGLGEPCFDKLEAKLAHAMMSIPATKGFEIGSGFEGTRFTGREHNDKFVSDGNGGLKTVTNNSGGIQGGISNGEHIYFRVAFKPPATISLDQNTAQYDGTDGVLATRGRHDPCVVPRAVPIVEAMAALVIMDAVMIQNARSASVQRLAPVPSELKAIKPF